MDRNAQTTDLSKAGAKSHVNAGRAGQSEIIT